jgi:hypothetical protein
MKFGRKITKGLVLPLLLLGSVLNCTNASFKSPPTVTIKPMKSHGPPPHAPAHGYRARTSDGVEVVYNSKLGVYVVFGISSYYYSNELYYRVNSDQWEVSAKFHGPWKAVAEYEVPFSLRYGIKAKAKGKGKHKG